MWGSGALEAATMWGSGALTEVGLGLLCVGVCCVEEGAIWGHGMPEIGTL